MTPAQVRMARAALGVSVDHLARDAIVPPEAITALEQGTDEPQVAAKLRATFEVAGVEFLGDDGVKFHGTPPDTGQSLQVENLNSANDE